MYDHSTWEEYGYTFLPMGIASSIEFLQKKPHDLFHIFEFIREYIDGFLVLTKKSRLEISCT